MGLGLSPLQNNILGNFIKTIPINYSDLSEKKIREILMNFISVHLIKNSNRNFFNKEMPCKIFG